jgi:hypothetical protein
MSKSKRIKGRKSDPEQIFWLESHRRQTAKALRERNKPEKKAAKAAKKASASKGRS